MTDGLPELGTAFEWRRTGEVVWLESLLGAATAAFSTRLGGVSEGSYRSLNLGILTEDVRDRVVANRQALARALGRDAASIVMGRQVHGAAVQIREVHAEAAPVPDSPLEADAQVTAAQELTPLVLVADCVPLVLASPGAVAAVHCGWRGVAAGVVEQALSALHGRAPGKVHAALGPGIGPCCYEVGGEVREAFRARGHSDDVMRDGRLDLALAVRGELEQLGVGADRVYPCGLCTSCSPELFFSHRRDRGLTGRQAGLAWLSS